MLELNAGNVVAYAVSRGLVTESSSVRVEPLAGGVSCEVLRLHRDGDEPVVIKQALPKLRVAADWYADPARIEREVIVMGLARDYLGSAHVPAVLDYDADHFIYAMSSAPLDARNWKRDLLDGRLETGLAEQCGRLLARFHGIPVSGRDRELLEDKTYFYQLRVEAYLEHSARNAPELESELTGLAAELMDSRLCLTHADFTPKNFLVTGEDLILLDYEVSHIGHGVFDTASILNHFFLKAVRDGSRWGGFEILSRAFLSCYRSEGGVGAGDDILWRCLGALMLARVIGKSPVEYLDSAGKLKARLAAVRLLSGQITDLGELYALPG